MCISAQFISNRTQIFADFFYLCASVLICVPNVFLQPPNLLAFMLPFLLWALSYQLWAKLASQLISYWTLNLLRDGWSGRPDLNWGLPAPKLSAPFPQSIHNLPIWYTIQDVGLIRSFRLVDVISSIRVWFRFVASTKSSIRSVWLIS